MEYEIVEIPNRRRRGKWAELLVAIPEEKAVEIKVDDEVNIKIIRTCLAVAAKRMGMRICTSVQREGFLTIWRREEKP